MWKQRKLMGKALVSVKYVEISFILKLKCWKLTDWWDLNLVTRKLTDWLKRIHCNMVFSSCPKQLPFISAAIKKARYVNSSWIWLDFCEVRNNRFRQSCPPTRIRAFGNIFPVSQNHNICAYALRTICFLQVVKEELNMSGVANAMLDANMKTNLWEV